MGPRSSEVLSEIERVKARLDAGATELEARMPALLRATKRTAGLALGGGAGGGILFLAVKRMAKRRKGAKASVGEQPPRAQPPVVVKVLPAGVVPVALVAVAVWAGVRVFEALRSSAGDAEQPVEAVVRPMPRSGTA